MSRLSALPARFSLRLRIVMAVALAQVAALALTVALWLGNARNNLEEETAAALSLARTLVLATVASLHEAIPPDQIATHLPLRLAQPRHVQITVMDAQGAILPPLRPEVRPPQAAPRWFSAALLPTFRSVTVPLTGPGPAVGRGAGGGRVVISADPSQRLAELWQDARLMILGLGGMALAQALLIWWGVGRGLAPLERLRNTVDRLTGGDLTARAGKMHTPDLAPLADGVDRLAETLSRTEAERARLSQSIVRRGDDERKAIARDLHDAYGPCLFALRAEGAALRDKAPDAAIRAQAETILAITAEIQRVNAALLANLRPMSIGQLPLHAVLDDFFADLRRRFPAVAWELNRPELPNTPETFDLTVFRILQEGTTNALRHSGATRVEAVITRIGSRLHLRLTDNGSGIPPGRPEGSGLTGMRERIALLGGHMMIRSDASGTVLDARLPISDTPPQEDQA